MISIEKMSMTHVAQIAQLEKACFPDPWSANSIASELDNPLSSWLVAVEDGQVLGYVGSQAVLEEADMMNLAVRPTERRKGIARALVETLCAELHERGNHCLSLEVRFSNLPARGLYEKLGFVQVGCRKNYYCSPREDALILRRELP